MSKLKTLQDYSAAWKGGFDCHLRQREYGADWDDCDDPLTFLELSPDERRLVLGWIDYAIQPRKTVCKHRTSYGLKHVYQYATKEYVTNGQFKGAMIMAGYAPHDPTALNPCYRISKIVREEELPNA